MVLLNTLYEPLHHIALSFEWDYIVSWLNVSVLMQHYEHKSCISASVSHQYHKRFHS